MRNEIENLENRESWKSWNLLGFIILFVFVLGLMFAATGCTLSVGAEGRAYYPETPELGDPRESFFEKGIDGIFGIFGGGGGGGGGGFATLGG
jgi:hypothetical protein